MGVRSGRRRPGGRFCFRALARVLFSGCDEDSCAQSSGAQYLRRQRRERNVGREGAREPSFRSKVTTVRLASTYDGRRTNRPTTLNLWATNPMMPPCAREPDRLWICDTYLNQDAKLMGNEPDDASLRSRARQAMDL